MRNNLSLAAYPVATLVGWLLLFPAQPAAAQFPRGLPLPGGAYQTAPAIKRVHTADSPPGVVGGARLQRWGTVAGYYQPVVFRGPGATSFGLALEGNFQPPQLSADPLHAGLLVGAVYRFRITSIPGHEGEELFPTIEVIDRTYPPHHLATRYPIPVNLELDDLRDALAGKLVTRVIYLEDPDSAVPVDTQPESGVTFDIPPYQDPLDVADALGRPVAIVRIGSVMPPNHPELMPEFLFGNPPWMMMQAPPPVEEGAFATISDDE